MNQSTSNKLPSVLGVGLFIIFFLVIGQAFGMFAVMGSLINYTQNGPPPEPTLEDYDAVQSIGVAGETSLRVTLADDPRMANYNTLGGEGSAINQVALTSADGEVTKRVELEPGQTAVVFNIDGGRAIEGKYTLALINYDPPVPGVFGSPESEVSELVKFNIEDGAVTVTEVPYGASSYASYNEATGGDSNG